jgi:hypothetical protein
MRRLGAHIVQQAWRCEPGMDVHAWSERRGWDVREGVCLGNWGWRVDPRMRRRVKRGVRRMSWGRESDVWEGRRSRGPG